MTCETDHGSLEADAYQVASSEARVAYDNVVGRYWTPSNLLASEVSDDFLVMGGGQSRNLRPMTDDRRPENYTSRLSEPEFSQENIGGRVKLGKQTLLRRKLPRLQRVPPLHWRNHVILRNNCYFKL
jgi:hypothetical protein